jgi:hypothetical protein
MNIIKKNFWAAIGLVVAILSIVLAFYFAREKKREPVYMIKNKPSLIFDKSSSSPKIKLLVDDTLLITQNIYVTTLEIWNKGRLPITKEDIREDFYVSCSDSLSKILDYKILDEKEKGISNFKLLPIDNGLKIVWDYFDPGFGFLFQIIYSGSFSSEVKISGYVLDTEVKRFQWAQGSSKLIRILFYSLLGMFPLYIFMSWFTYSRRKKFKGLRKHDKPTNYRIIFFLTILIIAMLIVWFIYFKDDILKVNIPF